MLILWLWQKIIFSFPYNLYIHNTYAPNMCYVIYFNKIKIFPLFDSTFFSQLSLTLKFHLEYMALILPFLPFFVHEENFQIW